MDINTLVVAYERSVLALNLDAETLRSKIRLLQDRGLACDLEGRLAARLGFLQHQLDTLHHKHRAANCWVTTIAEPMYAVIGKQLGAQFRRAMYREADNLVEMRFTHASEGAHRSMTLRIELDDTYLAKGDYPKLVNIHRTVSHPVHGEATQQLSLDEQLQSVAAQLVA